MQLLIILSLFALFILILFQVYSFKDNVCRIKTSFDENRVENISVLQKQLF